MFEVPDSHRLMGLLDYPFSHRFLACRFFESNLTDVDSDGLIRFQINIAMNRFRFCVFGYDEVEGGGVQQIQPPTASIRSLSFEELDENSTADLYLALDPI